MHSFLSVRNADATETKADHETIETRYAEWSPERFQRWGASIGPQTEGLMIAILSSRPHPEQGFRTCLGVLNLYREIDAQKAEAVSTRAVEISGLNCKSISALIKTYKAPRHSDESAAVGEHANLRGPSYFH